jgi:hypothetical protein
MLHWWHLASLYVMSVIVTFPTPEERPDDERGARRHPPEAGLLTAVFARSLALWPPRLPYLRQPGAFQEELPRAIEPPGGRLAAGRTPSVPVPGDSGIHRQAGSPGTPGHRLTPPPAPPGWGRA